MRRHFAVTILSFLASIGNAAAGPLNGGADGWSQSVTVEGASPRPDVEATDGSARLPSLAALGEVSPAPASEPGQSEQRTNPGSHLANLHGTVLLNRGMGFQPVTGDVPVSPGDRVRVVEGSIDIVYWNGTVVPVQSGQMIVILSNPPAEPGWFGEVSNPVLIGGGGALVGVGVGLALLEGHSSQSKPASP